jgi:hypothetical protein
MLNFLQLAGTPTSEEWDEVQDEVEEESEDEGYELLDVGDAEDEEEDEQELQEGEFAAVLGELLLSTSVNPALATAAGGQRNHHWN